MDISQKQLQALASPANEIFFGGAAGGGKSFLLRLIALLFAKYCPGINVYLFRRTYEDLKLNHLFGGQNLILMAQSILGPNSFNFNKQGMTLHANNGSLIAMRHAQHEQDVQNYRGPDFHVLLIDELTHFTEFMYRFLRSRVRLGGWVPPNKYKTRLPLIVTASNPTGVGHNFAKLAFVDQGPNIIKQMSEEEGGMLRQYIPSLLSDNPFIENEYASKLKGLGSSHLVDAMLKGLWDNVENSVFANCYREKVHKIVPFRIPKGWFVSRSFDWGFSKPYSSCWFAVSDGSPAFEAPKVGANSRRRTGTLIEPVEVTNPVSGRYIKNDVFLIDENYGWTGKANEGVKKTTSQMTKSIKETELNLRQRLLDGKVVAPGAADNAIYDGSAGKSIASQMEQEGVVWTKSNKKPGSRVQGLQEFQQRFYNGLPSEESPTHPREKPGFFVFNTCQQFFRTVPSLTSDPKKLDDVDTSLEDHIYDTCRYALMEAGEKIGYVRVL